MNMNFSPSDIVQRIKQGGSATSFELDLTRKKLNNPAQDDDIYNLIRIVGLSSNNNEEDVKLLERYLFDQNDDWILQAAIYALCEYMNRCEIYIDKLLDFSKLEKWEIYSSAAIASMSSIGKYLNKNTNACLVKKMLMLLDKDIELMKNGSYEFNKQHLSLVYDSLNYAVKGPAALLENLNNKNPQNFDDRVLTHCREIARKCKKNI